MNYKIGEVAKLLNMSIQTIRFYEIEGVVHPERLKESQYRIYDIWDIFDLVSCMKYKTFGISVKEIVNFIRNEDIDFLQKKLREKRENIEKSIQYNTILQESIYEYCQQIETIKYNIGNYWIRQIPRRYLLIYSEIEMGAKYGKFNKENPLFAKWLDYLPFVVFGQRFVYKKEKKYKDQGCLIIQTRYANMLDISIDSSIEILPEQLYLCSVIDMENKDGLTLSTLDPIFEFVKKKGYLVNGDIIGEMMLRTNKSDTMHRYIYIQIPIKKA